MPMAGCHKSRGKYIVTGNVSGEKEYVDNVFHLRFAHMSIRLVV